MNIKQEIASRGRVYRQVKGKGVLSNKNSKKQIKCSFDLVQYQDGRIYLFYKILPSFVKRALEDNFFGESLSQITGTN